METLNEQNIYKALGVTPENGGAQAPQAENAGASAEAPAAEGETVQESAVTAPEENKETAAESGASESADERKNGETDAESSVNADDGTEIAQSDAAVGENVPDVQTLEQRRENAARRRRAEQQAAIDQAVNAALEKEREKAKSEWAAFFEKANLKNSISGQPIRTMEEFNAWHADFETARLQRELKEGTIAGGTDGMESTWYHSGAQTESLQIHIDDRDNEGIFRMHFDYQTDKFTEHEIDRMYGHIINLLFDAIKDDSKPLYELEILSADEKQKLLHDFNDTAADYPREKCVHRLFEEQVKKTPDKTAIIACDRTLTYEELNEQANQIANGLIEKGVKPGDIVAFALPRRSYLITAMFGILKAGAAYLPIDSDYPTRRTQ